MDKIIWFKTGVHEEEITAIREALLQGQVSMGDITMNLEARLAQTLGIPYCLMTPSGSVALFIALKAIGIGSGDEVIVPNRGWVAAAHAVMLAGARVVLSDVRCDIPVIDVEEMRKKITPLTKAVIPLHLNGRSADMPALLSITRKYGIAVIEDACQAFFSKNKTGFLGIQSDIGCYSLGMAKLVATGQGGFVVTRNELLYKQLIAIRNHGVKDNFTDAWYQWGFNFKFTDLQAAMGLVQMDRVPQRIKHLLAIYEKYSQAISQMKSIRMIPVNIEAGELPLFIEVLVDRRNDLISYLKQQSIQTRLPTPNLHPTGYFNNQGDFSNSMVFEKKGLYLPCGPEQPIENVNKVLFFLKEFENNV